jgi:serine O-acetyltransferase
MSALREDLRANGRRSGLVGLVWALVFSPGFVQILLHRASCATMRGGPPGRLLSSLIWRVSVHLSGCYFSRLAEIGPGLRLPHPVGIVIGDSVKIGRNVALYQNVTIGLAEAVEDGSEKAYPEIGDGVTIYAGAVIIGPIRIGKGAVVGANAVVTRDVPENVTVAGVPARILHENRHS